MVMQSAQRWRGKRGGGITLITLHKCLYRGKHAVCDNIYVCLNVYITLAVRICFSVKPDCDVSLCPHSHARSRGLCKYQFVCVCVCAQRMFIWACVKVNSVCINI